MEGFLIILAIVIVGYIAIASQAKWWPFKASASEQGRSRQQAIIDTLKEKAMVDGAVVFSQAPLSLAVRQGIIDGFAERIAAARARGWATGLDPAKYVIYVFPSVRDHSPDGTYSPVFAVFIDAGSPYDGSIYDQEPNSPGGYIFAAEQVLMRGDVPQDKFIIAQNDSQEYTATAVANGLDHLFAYYNDRDLYERTKYHADGVSGHPLW